MARKIKYVDPRQMGLFDQLNNETQTSNLNPASNVVPNNITPANYNTLTSNVTLTYKECEPNKESKASKEAKPSNDSEASKFNEPKNDSEASNKGETNTEGPTRKESQKSYEVQNGKRNHIIPEPIIKILDYILHIITKKDTNHNLYSTLFFGFFFFTLSQLSNYKTSSELYIFINFFIYSLSLTGITILRCYKNTQNN